MVDNVTKYTRLLEALTESSVVVNSAVETGRMLSNSYDGFRQPDEILEVMRSNDELLAKAIANRKLIEGYINGAD